MTDKLHALRAMLRERQLGGILIERQNNFSWLTGGRGFIGLAAEMACGAILVTMSGAYVLANNIEAHRLAAEECPGLEPVDFPWTAEGTRAGLIEKLAPGGVASDGQLAAEFFALRTVMDGAEQQALAMQGPAAALALEDAVRALRPGDSELALAGAISARLWASGFEPITLLIAFDERIRRYRHPVPTDNPFRQHALAAICARRAGLIYSVTRCAHLHGVPAEIAGKHDAVCRVDAALMAAAKPGAGLASLFDVAKDAYAREGFSQEIQNHHQGGLTGYVARERKIQPGEAHVVRLHEAYAFNPSVCGAKSEDTMLVTPRGPQILTLTGRWPQAEFSGLARPLVLAL